MANYCTYGMLVKGDKEKIEEFKEKFFDLCYDCDDPETCEDIECDDYVVFKYESACRYSVMDSMIRNAYDDGDFIRINDLAAEFNLELEIFSFNDEDDFEHYYFKNNEPIVFFNLPRGIDEDLMEEQLEWQDEDDLDAEEVCHYYFDRNNRIAEKYYEKRYGIYFLKKDIISAHLDEEERPIFNIKI